MIVRSRVVLWSLRVKSELSSLNQYSSVGQLQTWYRLGNNPQKCVCVCVWTGLVNEQHKKRARARTHPRMFHVHVLSLSHTRTHTHTRAHTHARTHTHTQEPSFRFRRQHTEPVTPNTLDERQTTGKLMHDCNIPVLRYCLQY